jgi:hypothetical protein
MSKDANISLHFQLIHKAQQLPVGCDKRIAIISRSIQGIIRAMSVNYNPSHI